MKRFLKNTRLVIILAATILALAIIGVTIALKNNQSNPLFAQKYTNDTTSIVAKVVNWPFEQIDNGVKSVQDLLGTYDENKKLKSKVDDVAATKVRNSALESENKQLKAALKLKKTLTDYDLVEANVISRTPSSWSNTVVIDQGSNNGVKKNMLVMAATGLVGQVVEADSISSKVELLSSTNSSANKISVQLDAEDETTVHGIITSFDKKSGYLQLSQIENSDQIKKGTKVYTSGLGGNSPKGLLVGKVVKKSKDGFGLSNIIQVKPSANLNNFDIVSVVIKGTDNVE